MSLKIGDVKWRRDPIYRVPRGGAGCAHEIWQGQLKSGPIRFPTPALQE